MDHTFKITVLNNPLGIPQSSDGVMMLFVQAKAISSTFALETAYLLTGMNDVAALGITAALDTTNGTAIYQQLSEFYGEAGNGALLWLVGVDMTASTNEFATYVAKTNTVFTNLIKGTALQTPANRVKMIGLCYALPTTHQELSDFPADVPATLTAMQLTQADLFNQGFPFNFIVDGYNMSAIVTTTGIGTQENNTVPNGSLCITGSTPNGVSSVGAALGRFAKISVGHGFDNVSDGGISLTSAYLTNGTSEVYDDTTTLVVGVTYLVSVATVTYNSIDYKVGQTFTAITGHTSFTGSGKVNAYSTPVQSLTSGFSGSDVSNLGSKQFMFLCTLEGQQGLYWNDGATCCASTLPLSSQEFGRVANKLASEVRAFMISTKGQNLPIDKKTGLVDQGYCNTKQEQFYNESIVPIKTNGGTGDITDAQLTMTGTPNGNRIIWNFVLVIIPTPIVGGASGTIVFSYTL